MNSKTPVQFPYPSSGNVTRKPQVFLAMDFGSKLLFDLPHQDLHCDLSNPTLVLR